MEFQDKVVIITGSAGGIGKVTAEMFAKEGATLVLVDLNKDRLEALCKNLATDTAVISFAIDVSNEQEVKNVIQSTIEKFGKIDVLEKGAEKPEVFTNAPKNEVLSEEGDDYGEPEDDSDEEF